MPVRIERLPIPRLQLGEGPHWDAATGSLLFVDAFAGGVHSYRPATGALASASLSPGVVSFIIPVEGERNRFVIGAGKTLKILDWDQSSGKTKTEEIARWEEDSSLNLINDGKCDPVGRLWAGTTGHFDFEKNTHEPEKGFLYSYEPGKGTTRHLSKIGISNGMTWDRDKFYYIDSLQYKVHSYDFDLENGTISNETVLYDLKKEGKKGLPDGMTIDSDGKLWFACFEGAKVLRIDPVTGRLMSEIEFPSYQVTSVAFGGDDLDELYVTSGDINQTEEIKKKYPDAGCTFKVTGLGVKGLPMVNFKKV